MLVFLLRFVCLCVFFVVACGLESLVFDVSVCFPTLLVVVCDLKSFVLMYLFLYLIVCVCFGFGVAR